MIEQLSEFKKTLKNFMDGEKTASDYLKLLTAYETARNKGTKVSEILKILEDTTNTRASDDDFAQ